ncbi:SDR family oxidoreductase [Aestuariivirga sp.]|uniref:SDR family oxidoreductase n=1 Tax=Aestuariivirga sp. TaxID=2650926 RepID=UPI0039E29ECC
MNHLLCFGMGFSGKALASRLKSTGWTITGTSRSAEGAAAIAAAGYKTLVFDGSAPLPSAMFDGVTHVVISVPPDSGGDPVLHRHTDDFANRAGQFAWVGYLSTTGVYGDHGGDWVTEETPLTPNTERGAKRLAAETAWLNIPGLPLQIFRLAGIYGPGRNQLLPVLDGTAKRIVKEGQVFSRIHVDDIAETLCASMVKPAPGRAYNVCDDLPAPPQDVVEYAAELLGLPPPPGIPFEEAQLSPMARSFYADSKRVSNARIKRELGVKLRYPTYREGLAALAKEIKR